MIGDGIGSPADGLVMGKTELLGLGSQKAIQSETKLDGCMVEEENGKICSSNLAELVINTVRDRIKTAKTFIGRVIA